MPDDLRPKTSPFDVAIDIGGTTTRILCIDGESGQEKLVRLDSQKIRSVQDVVDGVASLVDLGSIGTVAIGAAGPTKDGTVELTNLPWTIQQSEFERLVPGARISIMNDMEALAYGAVDPVDETSLRSGSASPNGAKVILAPGTGLGVAAIVWHDQAAVIVSTEAGHVSLAPIDALTAALVTDFEVSGVRATYERVLSGPGLARIFSYLVRAEGTGDDTPLPDPKVIVQAASNDPAGLEARAIQAFWAVLASYAGDLALVFKATGGVFLAGNIVNSTYQMIDRTDFVQAFEDKDPMESLVQDIPVNILHAEEPVLAGLTAFLKSERGTKPE